MDMSSPNSSAYNAHECVLASTGSTVMIVAITTAALVQRLNGAIMVVIYVRLVGLNGAKRCFCEICCLYYETSLVSANQQQILMFICMQSKQEAVSILLQHGFGIAAGDGMIKQTCD